MGVEDEIEVGLELVDERVRQKQRGGERETERERDISFVNILSMSMH